ncbi:hypothetical protein A0H76_216 [Hepatospora eriocheir]|uniref:Uncharacterized protein n=1 Tax=Hepatospora eriocheir TaxID=1081669 RepID=A0A1X0QJ16_9MICR|nr:hypothetical protein A0H76_216 [Hepatospora eriocheir]
MMSLSKNEIIEKNYDSLYATLSFPLIERNGFIRIISDFVALNKITIDEPCYFPSVEEMFIKLKCKKIFSKINLQKGFNQIQWWKIKLSQYKNKIQTTEKTKFLKK